MSSDTATTINPTTSPAATSMPRNTSGNALFRRQAIPGKGNGLIAIQDIKRGTRIMDEYAVIIGEPDTEIIYAKYCQLEQGAKDEFLQLHHVQKNNSKDNDLKSIVLDIFNTNCWYYPGGAAVYLQQSLLNHSCTPNTEVYMYGTMGRQSVQVLRDISSGEELTTSYLEHVLIPAYKRDLSTWGFVCQCDACHSNSSDRARSKIHNLLNSINNWKREPCLMSIGREEEEALADAIKLGEMLVDEGLVGIELATAYHHAAYFSAKYDQISKAIEYTHKALEVIEYTFGVDASSYIILSRILTVLLFVEVAGDDYDESHLPWFEV